MPRKTKNELFPKWQKVVVGFWIAGTVILTVIALTWPGKVSAPSKSPSLPPAAIKPMSIDTVAYRGRFIYCITLDEAFAGNSSCDFVRFYHDNPDLIGSGR